MICTCSAEGGEDFTDELFEAAFRRLVVHFGLSNRFFPRLREAGCLFTHEPDGVFNDGELSQLSATWLVLESRDVHAEVLVLFPHFFELLLKAVVAFGIDLELGVEVLLEIAAFFFDASDVALEISFRGKSGLPGEECKEETEEESSGKLSKEELFESFHFKGGVMEEVCLYSLGGAFLLSSLMMRSVMSVDFFT